MKKRVPSEKQIRALDEGRRKWNKRQKRNAKKNKAEKDNKPKK